MLVYLFCLQRLNVITIIYILDPLIQGRFTWHTKKKGKKAANGILVKSRVSKWNAHHEKKFMDACNLEENYGWTTAGQLLFILRAAADTLPIPLNLKCWRYRTDSRCYLYGSTFPTVLHILNGCPISLNQNWFIWRHGSVLQLLVQQMIPILPNEAKLYTDLPGHHASITPCNYSMHMRITTAKPDIVITKNGKVHLTELTILLDLMKALKNARIRGREKMNYQLVLSDLDARGVQSSLTTMEIGALGH